MTVFGSYHVKPTDVADLACFAKANVLSAPSIGNYKCSNCAGRGVNGSIANPSAGYGLGNEGFSSHDRPPLLRLRRRLASACGGAVVQNLYSL